MIFKQQKKNDYLFITLTIKCKQNQWTHYWKMVKKNEEHDVTSMLAKTNHFIPNNEQFRGHTHKSKVKEDKVKTRYEITTKRNTNKKILENLRLDNTNHRKIDGELRLLDGIRWCYTRYTRDTGILFLSN